MARQDFERAFDLKQQDEPTRGKVSEHEPRKQSPKVSVDFSSWEVMRGQYSEIARVYEFTGLTGPGSYTKFEIRCRLTATNDPSAGDGVAPFIYFIVAPHILEQGGHLVAQFGPSDDLIDYEFFNIKVEPIATGANFLLVDRAHDDQCLKVLMLGRQIMFRLMSDREELASFPLENDARFADAYSKLKRQILTKAL